MGDNSSAETECNRIEDNRNGEKSEKRQMKLKSKRSSSGSVKSTVVEQDFHIKNLHSHLKICIREHDGQVDMDAYIETFHQLNKYVIVALVRN